MCESIISGYLNFRFPLFTKAGEILSLILSTFNVISCIIIFPIFIIIVVLATDKKLDKKVFQKMF